MLRRIVFLPGWYPHQRRPLLGSFVQEQIRLQAEFSPAVQHFVLLTGQDALTLKLRDWNENRQIWAQWRGERGLSGRTTWLSPNLAEVYAPVLTWNPRFAGGNYAQVLRACLRQLRLIQRHYGPIDLLHAHVTFPAGWLAWRMSELCGIPFLLTEHQARFEPRFLPVWQAASKLLAVGKQQSLQLAALAGRTVQVIPNPLDERCFSLSRQLPASPIRFFCLARLDGRKGIADLLAALALALRERKDLRLVIGGSGPMLRSDQDLALRLGLSTQVEWLGEVAREQVPARFAEAHAFVLPSSRETMGIVYAEALASGKPVIATRCGGPEDFVGDRNGLLVDIGDVAGLAQALLTMAGHLTRFVPAVLRRDILAYCGRQQVLSQLSAVYAECLDDAGFHQNQQNVPGT